MNHQPMIDEELSQYFIDDEVDIPPQVTCDPEDRISRAQEDFEELEAEMARVRLEDKKYAKMEAIEKEFQENKAYY